MKIRAWYQNPRGHLLTRVQQTETLPTSCWWHEWGSVGAEEELGRANSATPSATETRSFKSEPVIKHRRAAPWQAWSQGDMEIYSQWPGIPLSPRPRTEPRLWWTPSRLSGWRPRTDARGCSFWCSAASCRSRQTLLIFSLRTSAH